MNATLLIPLLCVAGLTGCNKSERAEAPSGPKLDGTRVAFNPQSPQASAIVTRAAEPKAGEVLHLNGRLVWNEDATVHVYTPFGGRVSRIVAQTGTTVAKDAPLAVVSSPEFGQAQAESTRAALDLKFAEQNLKRLNELSAIGAAPQKDLRAAEIEYSRAQAELARASGKVALYGGTANVVDQEFVLRSPLAGTVVDKSINPGQEVRPDQMTANAAPLFVITDPARLWVLLDATEGDLPALRPGGRIVLRSRTYPDRTFSGTIDTVSSFVDPASRTVKLRGSVDNAEGLLKAEMYVTAELAAKETAGVDVPATAVYLRGDRHYTFIEEAKGAFRRQEVKIGLAHFGHVTVVEGLVAGQKVVTDGALFLDQMLTESGG